MLRPPLVVISQVDGTGRRGTGGSRWPVGVALRTRRGRLPGGDGRKGVGRGVPIERRRTRRNGIGVHRRGRTLGLTAILPVRRPSQRNGDERNPQQGHRGAQSIWSRYARHMMTCHYTSGLPYIPLERRVPRPTFLFTVSLRGAFSSSVPRPQPARPPVRACDHEWQNQMKSSNGAETCKIRGGCVYPQNECGLS